VRIIPVIEKHVDKKTKKTRWSGRLLNRPIRHIVGDSQEEIEKGLDEKLESFGRVKEREDADV
jgi:hypothetical protein